jgi:hypothetical protein
MGVKVTNQKQMVYNFEVEGFHNYFVSNDGILVHNACEKPNPLENTKYREKVINQMQPKLKTGKPDYHGFPDIVDNYAGDGTQTTITGGDGITRTKIELEGSYGNKIGKFEWIIEGDRSINHRLFVPKK